MHTCTHAHIEQGRNRSRRDCSSHIFQQLQCPTGHLHACFEISYHASYDGHGIILSYYHINARTWTRRPAYVSKSKFKWPTQGAQGLGLTAYYTILYYNRLIFEAANQPQRGHMRLWPALQNTYTEYIACQHLRPGHHR